jgi:hypothetical protein
MNMFCIDVRELDDVRINDNAMAVSRRGLSWDM